MNYIVSGYFLAYHNGHKEYIKSVESLMKDEDNLLIIVNNGYQQTLKYGKCIRSPVDIINEMEKDFPNATFIVSSSLDRTINSDLEKLWGIFVKDGGEYNKDNLPEAKTCKKYGIKMLFLNNNKIASSSEILGLEK